jgi:hypothetical protein
VVAKAVSSRDRVKVALLELVFVTTMLVTIAVVLEGTVYKVVEVLVVAAPLNSTFAVVVIKIILQWILYHRLI